MVNRRERILALLEMGEGLTDREITNELEGKGALQQPINQICRRLDKRGILIRQKRSDGLIGNYLVSENSTLATQQQSKPEKYQNKSIQTRPEKRVEDSEDIKHLREIGFERAGKWSRSGNEMTFTLTKYSRIENFLYAFVVNGDVKYIGKSTQEAYRRIFGYKKPGSSQSTNIRINENLLECLISDSHTVDIYIFYSKDTITFNGIPINLAAGLEDNVKEVFDPEWNVI